MSSQHPVFDRLERDVMHAAQAAEGWFTRTHPLELPSGRILVPMYSDGYSYGIMAISDDRRAQTFGKTRHDAAR